MDTDVLTRLQEFYVAREIGHRLIRRPEDVPSPAGPPIQYLIAGNGVFLETALVFERPDTAVDREGMVVL